MKISTYRFLNHILLIVLVVLAGYIMFIPFVPEISAFVALYTDKTKGYKYDGKLTRRQAAQEGISTQYLRPIPKENILVIPQIGVDAPVIRGIGPDVLERGLWLRPRGSTPAEGGNTVITGHRFLYRSGPKTFYNLDKLKVGDKFFMFWEGKEYIYEVSEIFIVSPDNVEIEKPDAGEKMLTLYTCTPLWSAKDRLVVRSRLIN
jgi:LPXTG-site transpeptidase (sortase) family protein